VAAAVSPRIAAIARLDALAGEGYESGADLPSLVWASVRAPQQDVQESTP
jgi:hypothetical protein